VRRLIAIPLALALAGCGTSTTQRESGDGTGAPPSTTTTKPAASKPHRRAAPEGIGSAAVVTVVDGNTHARVAGARVRVGARSGLTDRNGVARIWVRRRAPLVTFVHAPGYPAKTLRIPFQQQQRSTVRVFRPALQWPMYGVDPQRTQAQTQIRLRPPFRTVWSRGVGSLAEFPAVVSDGVAYVTNFRGMIFALGMADGRPLWRRQAPDRKMASSPAVWGRWLVVHGMNGHVSVLRRSDGRLVWSFATGSPIESSPVVRDGIDYFGTWNGVVYALDLDRRRLVWTSPHGCKITSSVALSGSTVYLGDYCGRLLALARETGRTRWSGAVNGRIYGTPAIAGGRVFVPSSTGGSLTAFSTGGRTLWRRSVGSYVYSAPAVWKGRVFFGSYGGVFYALSAASGRTLWSVGAGGSISGAAVVVDGVAYAGSFANRILGVDAQSGRVVLDFPHGQYVPVSGDGGRLLLHGYSRLWAVEPR
jgi:outer membrane protein assembly factor BamB